MPLLFLSEAVFIWRKCTLYKYIDLKIEVMDIEEIPNKSYFQTNREFVSYFSEVCSKQCFGDQLQFSSSEQKCLKNCLSI